MGEAYRSTQSAFVCEPTNYLKDLTVIEDLLGRYRNLGGKVPPQIQNALEVAKTGKNIEDSMNIACDGLFKFYLSEEVRCAKKAGFSSLEQMQAERAGRWQDIEQSFDPCIASVARKWQLTNIDYTINPFNQDSALREFIEKTKGQIFSVTSKWVKKSVMKKVKGEAPSYERLP